MSMCTIIRPPTSVLGLGSFWLDNLQYFCQRWRASDTFARSLRFDGFCAAFFNCHPRFSRTDSLTTLRLTLVQVCLGITVVQVHQGSSSPQQEHSSSKWLGITASPRLPVPSSSGFVSSLHGTVSQKSADHSKVLLAHPSRPYLSFLVKSGLPHGV